MSIVQEIDTAFAIHACDRCRKRKAKCDPGFPSCRSCRASDSICAYTDARTRQTLQRSQVLDLEDQVAQLESQLRQLGVDPESIPDIQNDSSASSVSAGQNSADNPHPDLIHLESGGDGHFLGASSGLHLARSVLESARRNSTAFDEHDPNAGSGESQDAATGEDQNTDPGGTVTEIALPSWETVTRLVDNFFRQYEIQYPILARDEFVTQISDLYFATDPLERQPSQPGVVFMLNMVLSISLMFVEDLSSAKLAERFRLNATAQLRSVMKAGNHQTLQCLLLLLLSSTLSSRSAPMWYISGICMRMCVDLGYHTEKTIWYGFDGRGQGAEPDTKRRLFWVTYTFDRSLAKMLGRPFFIDDEKIDVHFPTESIPDVVIAPVHHWLTMQRMQSEIVSKVYALESLHSQRASETSIAAWKKQIDQKLVDWSKATKGLDAGGRYTAEWWEYWYQHAKLMLNQPKPRASKESVMTAFEAADTMVRLSFIRAHYSVAEFSWLDIHLQLVSGLTMLFLVLKSPPIREKAQREWVRFKGCIIEWQVVLGKLAKRWTSMVKTKSVLSKLADGILDSIEKNKLPGGNDSRVRKDRRNTRLTIEELTAPGDLTLRVRSPRSVTQGQTSTRKRRRGNTSIEETGTQHDEISSASSGATPRSSKRIYDPQADANYYLWTSAQDTYGGALDSVDFPSILGGDLFTDIDQLGAPLQLDLGLFDQPEEWMATANADPFGFQWMGGGLDPTTLTDSVLNFRGSREDEPTQPGYPGIS